MNQITLNLIAIGIFSVVLMILVGPLVQLSPFIPAVLCGGILVLAAVDTLALQGLLGDLLIDGIAQQDPEYRRRILRHEAGHFLVAHLLKIPVTDYTLSAWEAFKKGQRGRGGVQFDLNDMLQQAEMGQLAASAIDTYCTVWMAGIAAEQMSYERAEGGEGDRRQIRLLWSRLNAPNANCDMKMRWATLQAKTLLERHQESYEALVERMGNGLPTEECNIYLDNISLVAQGSR
ncbi:MAG: ATP-dependent Zn protease [Cyanobacteria bacterium P01_F01_bin.150]